MYWLDEAEPEVELCDYDTYRFYLGPDMQVGNVYPLAHSKMAYDGLKSDGAKDILNLVRCAWIGSAKYGALVWSGDVESSFREMKVQVYNGINMGVAGIPWWISDTGGFYGGNIYDPEFRELIVRWYQWAVFTSVLRMHGDRLPNLGVLDSKRDHGGGFNPSGAENELWSYGEENYEIFVKYLGIRESLKPYLKKISEEACENGLPVIRAMFLHYPEDKECWRVNDQYMFGPDYIVAPVTDYGARERSVYLPEGLWEAMDGSGTVESKGEYVTAKAPIDYMPVYRRV